MQGFWPCICLSVCVFCMLCVSFGFIPFIFFIFNLLCTILFPHFSCGLTIFLWFDLGFCVNFWGWLVWVVSIIYIYRYLHYGLRIIQTVCASVCMCKWLYDRGQMVREHPGTTQCADLCVTWWIACSHKHLIILHTIHKNLTQKPYIKQP